MEVRHTPNLCTFKLFSFLTIDIKARFVLLVSSASQTQPSTKKIPEGFSCENLRYNNASSVVILPSYKEASTGKTTRRVKKKEEFHGCLKFGSNLQLKTQAYELKEEKNHVTCI
jgi:hypothetical protein